ncbi:MAG TPA: cytochrome c [Steroidobacteraceae bacterium]|jgi:mono/diheme cytochrome c family protein|nr:cytochrome c [Steroidobacteraceae bacterium]
MLRLCRLVPLGVLMVACAGCSRQSGRSPAASAGAAADTAGRGAALYGQNCVPCHRENGEGVPKVFPSLSGSPAVTGDPVELAQWVLSQKRPASIPAGRYPTQMLLFGWMSDPDAAAVLTYIRSHFGNSAAPVDAATIAKSREK